VKEEEGGLAMACARAGGPGNERVRSGSGNPGTVASGHAWGRQGKREKGERAGEAGWWASLWSGSRLLVKEREGERMAGGPRVAVKCFQIGSKCSN
jgi:hypothetical protein